MSKILMAIACFLVYSVPWILILLYIPLSYPYQWVRRIWKQRQAKKGLPPEHVQLLSQLWEKEKERNYYRTLHSTGYCPKGDHRLANARQESELLKQQCEHIPLDNWRITAHLSNTYY